MTELLMMKQECQNALLHSSVMCHWLSQGIYGPQKAGWGRPVSWGKWSIIDSRVYCLVYFPFVWTSFRHSDQPGLRWSQKSPQHFPQAWPAARRRSVGSGFIVMVAHLVVGPCFKTVFCQSHRDTWMFLFFQIAFTMGLPKVVLLAIVVSQIGFNWSKQSKISPFSVSIFSRYR